jgi:hypothetical protein
MFAGFAAILVIAVAAKFGLGMTGFSSQEVHSSDSVRLN